VIFGSREQEIAIVVVLDNRNRSLVALEKNRSLNRAKLEKNRKMRYVEYDKQAKAHLGGSPIRNMKGTFPASFALLLRRFDSFLHIVDLTKQRRYRKDVVSLSRAHLNAPL
jgi:CRISPR/Cas system CMR-associated protein Cmr1 (group 7 of RAMP superfamily)